MEDLAAAMRAYAYGLPEAWEDHPWGEDVAKVGKKVFAFFGEPEGEVGLTVKLPISGEEALAMPFTKPAGYGLDRGGWVSVHVPPDAPLDLLLGWIEESYRTVAPARLVQQLDEAAAARP
jgi:predicted DNA-binding protein (MmcQ/YjbR family)